MTATPIPRTLHMALAGIRDLSVIDTPPEDRVPIKTYVLPYDGQMVREAVRRELDRGGQVYFYTTACKASTMWPTSSSSWCRGRGRRGPRPAGRAPA